MKKRLIVLLLCLALILSACGKAPTAPVEDYDAEDCRAAITELAFELIDDDERGNMLISPVSVITALAMAENGAEGNTLAQIEELTGVPAKELFAYIYDYMQSLEAASKPKLHMANSVWINDASAFTANPDFIKSSEDWFSAEVKNTPFDENFLKQINKWVDKNTDGMIEKLYEDIPKGAVMCLVNALAFEAKWQSEYEEWQINDGQFFAEDGSVSEASFMSSDEQSYLSDENAKGFIKYYADGEYAFAALLPDEGVSVWDYIKSLNGEKLGRVLDSAESCQVKVTMPQFESEYKVELSDTLKSLGMTDAFDAKIADFSKMGKSDAGNVSISEVLHKTYISVDTEGTKAAAVTGITMKDAALPPENIKELRLDRPFVYMIIDSATNLPLFIGVTVSV